MFPVSISKNLIKEVSLLQKIYFEGHGGGNGEESYHVPWYYAAKHVKTDAYEKRNQKGILITIGNDGTPSSLTAEQIRRFIGKEDKDYDVNELLDLIYDKFEIYHIHMEGSYGSNRIIEKWKKLITEERLVVIKDQDVNTIADVLTALCMKIKGYSVQEIKTELNNESAANAVAIIKKTTDLDKKELVEF